MAAEACLDEREHIPGDGVGRTRPGARHEQVRFCHLPVLRIEVPPAARRLVAVHQQPGAATHVAVEIFHPELLAARRPLPELRGRTQEALVRQDVDRDREALVPRCLHLRDAPFAGFRDDDAFRPMTGDRLAQLFGEGPPIVRRIQRHIVDCPAEGPQFPGEVAHG